jgi:hypothetical protein
VALERYLRPPGESRLVQGELLGPLWEYVPTIAPVEVPQGAEIAVAPSPHERVILITQDCDLEQDFQIRFPDGWLGQAADGVDDMPGAVPQVVFCDTFEDLRPRVAGSDIFKRAKRNQDERYHAFPEAEIEEVGGAVPELFIDFRRAVALPTGFVYAGIREGGVGRIALLPEIFRLDLAHRFYGYLSRIPVP